MPTNKQNETVTAYTGEATATLKKDPKDTTRAKSKEEEQDNIIQLGLNSAKMTSKTGRTNMTRTNNQGSFVIGGGGAINQQQSSATQMK